MKWFVSFVVSTATALISASALAAVTPQEADRLGKDLTPVGAEKAGNAEGTIPAYEGTDVQLPGWEWGKTRSEYWKYKDEKSLFTIDASNVDKYKDHLTDGQITALKTVKGYKMDVYPTHRDCAITPLHAQRTKENALEAKIGPDGWSFVHAKTAGVPFPLPKTGVEVMYNHRMRLQELGAIFNDGTSVISPRPGTDEFTYYKWFLYIYWPFMRSELASVEGNGNVEFYTYYNYSQPAALAGQGFVATNWMNNEPESYYYFPGQRRVRRLPAYIFDTPLIGFENQYLVDEQLGMWSTLDRFEYKLLGKKEIYLSYDNFHYYDYKSSLKDLFGKTHPIPEFRRFELHRVWVVDAHIKPGYRHLAPHRTYYVDEDSWISSELTDYDKNEKVWKYVETYPIPAWEIGGTCVQSPTLMWDLQGGRYVFDWGAIGGGKDIKWIKQTDPEAKQPWVKSDFYTPETLRSLSER
jgi:hypothetical protein